MWTVMVTKQSCKQGNHSILRGGHRTIPRVFYFYEKSWFFSGFHRFFHGCCGETPRSSCFWNKGSCQLNRTLTSFSLQRSSTLKLNNLHLDTFRSRGMDHTVLHEWLMNKQTQVVDPKHLTHIHSHRDLNSLSLSTESTYLQVPMPWICLRVATHVRRSPRVTTSSCTGITLRSKPVTSSSEEFTIIVTGASDVQYPLMGPIPERSDLRHPHNDSVFL